MIGYVDVTCTVDRDPGWLRERSVRGAPPVPHELIPFLGRRDLNAAPEQQNHHQDSNEEKTILKKFHKPPICAYVAVDLRVCEMVVKNTDDSSSSSHLGDKRVPRDPHPTPHTREEKLDQAGSIGSCHPGSLRSGPAQHSTDEVRAWPRRITSGSCLTKCRISPRSSASGNNGTSPSPAPSRAMTGIRPRPPLLHRWTRTTSLQRPI